METEDMIIIALAVLILIAGSVCAYVTLNGITFTEPIKLNETNHVNQTVNTSNINDTDVVPPSDKYESGARSSTGSATSSTYSANSNSRSVTPSQSQSSSDSQSGQSSDSQQSDTPTPSPTPDTPSEGGGSSDGGGDTPAPTPTPAPSADGGSTE